MPTKKKSVAQKPAKKKRTPRIKPIAPMETPIADTPVEVPELYKSCAEPESHAPEPLRILMEEEVLPPRKNWFQRLFS